MNKRLSSRLVRLNRKLAWLLVIASITVIFTGYAQSLQGFDRFLLRDIHILAEWAFITLLIYHVVVGTFLARYRYASSLGRIVRGRAGLGVLLRFVLRASSWPLLLLSAIVILSGLSWYGVITLSFNRHLEYDAIFFILFMVHVVAGAGVAIRRRWPSTRRVSVPSAQAEGQAPLSRRSFVRYAGVLGAVVAAIALGYSFLRRGPGGPGNGTPSNGNNTKPPTPEPGSPDLGAQPVQEGRLTIGNRGFTFDPREVETIRPDIFKPGFFSVFDILVHLDKKGKIALEYHFEEDLNANVIDRIDGEPNWWYMIYFSGGWPERSVFRPDHYPWKDGSTLRISREDPARLEAYYAEWRDEIRRKKLAGGKVILPTVRIRSKTFTREFRNVEVTAHNTRADMFQDGMITALDVIKSLGDQRKLSYDIKWYESMGSAKIVKDYWVEKIDQDRAHGRCGYVYEAGPLKYRRFTGNHIHLPTPSRVLNSPEYVEFFWICI